MTAKQLEEVRKAEHAQNLSTCLSGQFRALCRHDWLTSEQAKRVIAAERAYNLSVCIEGSFPELCNHGWLTEDQLRRTLSAEAKKAEKKPSISTTIPAQPSFQIPSAYNRADDANTYARRAYRSSNLEELRMNAKKVMYAAEEAQATITDSSCAAYSDLQDAYDYARKAFRSDDFDEAQRYVRKAERATDDALFSINDCDDERNDDLDRR